PDARPPTSTPFPYTTLFRSRVPAGESRRPHPHGHHRGEVEGRDPGGDAERLADRVDVDAGRGLLREAALQELRDPAAELDHLERSEEHTSELQSRGHLVCRL